MPQHLPVWVIEFIKLVGRRRLYPLVTQCPVCQQMVRLHDTAHHPRWCRRL
jgi:hypothetical protein